MVEVGWSRRKLLLIQLPATMTTVNPMTGAPLPADAIQRVLFVCGQVHVYNVPPLTSTKGYTAASWTADPRRQIFTARLRIIETALSGQDEQSTAVVLEDGRTGELFAAAPYTNPAIVEQVTDSSRFFALRVQGEDGRKATLGIGFEDRSQAFDFGVTLQEVRKTSGMEPVTKQEPEVKRDYSLKEGEMITVNLGGKSRRKTDATASSGTSAPLFSIPPPPSAHTSGQSQVITKEPTAEELGFDDGEFGEFQ
jgi:hypothetical protein